MPRKDSFVLQHQHTDVELGTINKGYVGEEINGNVLSVEVDKKTSEVNGSVTPEKAVETEEAERTSWDSPLEFLLSCISMSVGLGNVWRFPFAAYENGGGAFLIPYFIVLIFIGRPIYFLEMVLGQFSSFGSVKVWNVSPIFRGVGYGSNFGGFAVLTYYCSIMATTIYYFIASFQKDLPWAVCNPDWGEGICDENSTYFENNETIVTIPQLYYEKDVFPQLSDISDGIGTPHWRLSLCLLASWVIIFFALIKGVQSSGKVAYFTAIFPYIVLIILLIRGVTLDGAWEGIKYFIKPQWDKMYDPKVWYAAVAQCFFSMGTGFGVITFFSSYNPFRQNIYRDALIISFTDTFTSLLAGFTIFSILGSLALTLGVRVEDVAKGGPSLAFISYPDAISKFDWAPQLFSVLFFLMLFTLGVGTAASLTGGVITIICDQFPKLVRWHVTFFVCLVGFLIGLIYVTPGGQFMLTLVDYFGGNFIIYFMGTMEVVAISWVYGLNNFCKDIEFMLNIKIGFYWKFCWGFFIPVGLIAILAYALITSEQLTHEDLSYPTIAIVCGWLLCGCALALLPISAAFAIASSKGNNLKEKFFQSFKPTEEWGPRNPVLKQEWIEFKKLN